MPGWHRGTRALGGPGGRPGSGRPLARLVVAVVALLAVSAGSPSSVARAATTTVTVAVHDASHIVRSQVFVGAPVHASVRLSGILAPAGTVTVSRFDNGTCLGRPAATSKPATLVHGQVDVTGFVFTPREAGTYSFGATYAPGVGSPYDPASGCVKLTVVKGDAAVIVHFVADGQLDSTVEAGKAVQLEVIVVGEAGPPTPTGSVTLKRFSDDDCVVGETPIADAALVDGRTSFEVGKKTPGSYYYRVTYHGDQAYDPAGSPCPKLTITLATPTIQTVLHDPAHHVVTSVAVGTAVHASIHVVGFSWDGQEVVPTGSLTGYWYSDAACTAWESYDSATLLNGRHDFSGVARQLSIGTHWYRVVYDASSPYRGGDGPCTALTVTAATPTPVATPTAAAATPTPIASSASPSPGAASSSASPSASSASSLAPNETPQVSGPATTGAPSATASAPSATGSPVPTTPGSTGAGVDSLALVIFTLLVVTAAVAGFFLSRRRGERTGSGR